VEYKLNINIEDKYKNFNTDLKEDFSGKTMHN
jgi:hypothetical protein